MSVQDLTGSTAIVTGASRGGFGRGSVVAGAHAGAHVIGVARDHAQLQKVKSELGEMFIRVVADAADQVVAGQLIDSYLPRALVLNAGVLPQLTPATDLGADAIRTYAAGHGLEQATALKESS